MLGFPEWAWGVVGGLALGPVGLLILWPGCSRGAQALLTRFVVSVLVKLLLAGLGFWIVKKFLHVDARELVFGFMGGYFISLFLEIIPCIWKIRKCAKQASQAD